MARIGNNVERITSERTQDLGNVILEADERLDKVNTQWQSLGFGMANGIAA